MIRRLFRMIAAAFALLAIATPATAQLRPAPPEVPLWRLEANGDAVQTDLGFILPARIGPFERKGFTSTRPDGASVMTWYESPDGAISLRVLLQLRVDVRGVPMPGADALERNWTLLQIANRIEYGGAGEEISSRRIAWASSGERPNAIEHLARHMRDGAPVFHGIWYRNIGLWAVVVTAAGPEARRAEIEAAAEAVREHPWPSAPLTPDLRAMAPAFLRSVDECASFERGGTGEPVVAGPALAAVIGLGLTANFDPTTTAPVQHPVLDARPYCRIETFEVRGRRLVALGWRGDQAGFPAARYAFMTADGGTFLQVESLFSLPLERPDIRRLVWMTIAGERSLAAIHVFSDWPSYERAKALASATISAGTPTVVELSRPPSRINVTVGPAAGEEPTPAPAVPETRSPAPAPRGD